MEEFYKLSADGQRLAFAFLQGVQAGARRDPNEVGGGQEPAPIASAADRLAEFERRGDPDATIDTTGFTRADFERLEAICRSLDLRRAA